jgi:hypothetical protein
MISTLTVIGYVFLIASWVVPFMMRKQTNMFEKRQQSYDMGILLSAFALACFVSNMIIHFNK